MERLPFIRFLLRLVLSMLGLYSISSEQPLNEPYAYSPDTLIGLQTHGCLGTCQVYVIQILPNGKVTTFGLEHTPSSGPFQVDLSAEVLNELEKAFNDAGFCKLKDEYTSKGNSFVSDIPGTYLSFRCGESLKTVYDYYGTPAVVRDLEQKVQQRAQLERFLFADRATLEAKFVHGLPPSSREAQQLLVEATRWKDQDLVSYLLEKGVDANTPLLRTNYEQRPSALVTAVISNQIDMSRLLVNNGADTYSTNLAGETLLLSALRETGTAAMVSALIDFGGDVNQPDHGGTTPLMYAAMRLRPDLVKLLLDAGAYRNLTTDGGTTALTYARESRGCQEGRPGLGLNTVAEADDPDYTLCDKAKTISLLR